MDGDDDLADRARKLFAGPIDFLKSAPELKFLPDPDVPEIAFAGRSNVGKSSLLNALTNRKSLARTSNTPGRTQELNVFDVGRPPQIRLMPATVQRIAGPDLCFAAALFGVVGQVAWRRCRTEGTPRRAPDGRRERR